MALLTTIEAARRKGVHRTCIWQWIKEGRLKATQIGRDWLIDPRDLAPLTVRPRGQRPKKSA
jgi:excisionase family DNA binding protein